MGTTPNYGFPYPEPEDAPDGAAQIEALAAAADTTIKAHADQTTSVHGIPDTSALLTQTDLDGLATEADLTTVAEDLQAHETATAGVHGIPDTASLETQAGAQSKADAAQTAAETAATAALGGHTSATTNVHGIPDTSALLTAADLDGLATESALQAVSLDLSGHESATTNVHGIADTAELETQTGAKDKADAALADAMAYTDASTQSSAVITVEDFLAQPVFQVAHRGWGGEYPEHTAVAYASAVAAGVQAIEVSVNVTRDGVPVCFHDQTLDRMTGGEFTGPVVDWTYAALRERVRVKAQGLLGSGWSDQVIPTMREVLDAHLGRVVIFLEPKSSASVPIVQQQLLRFYPNAQRSVVWKMPYNSNSLPWAQNNNFTVWGYIDPGTTLGQMTTQNPLIDLWGVPSAATDTKFGEALSFGKPVMCWEVHRFSQRERLANLGVQGLMVAQGHYLNSTGALETKDSFATKIKAPGNFGPSGYEPEYALQYEDPDYAYIPMVNGQSVLMGSMSRMDHGPNGYEIHFEMTFPVVPAVNLHAGLAMCKESDDVYRFGVANASGGYHFLFRASSGDMQIYRHEANVQPGTQLGTEASAPAVAGVGIPFVLRVTPSQLIVTRTDTGTSLTVTHSEFRGEFFHVHNGSLTSTETIPRWRGIEVVPV